MQVLSSRAPAGPGLHLQGATQISAVSRIAVPKPVRTRHVGSIGPNCKPTLFSKRGALRRVAAAPSVEVETKADDELVGRRWPWGWP